MNEPKPFASLSPSLLARKGNARPAMRPQLAILPELALPSGEAGHDWADDLGWNDMGDDTPAPPPPLAEAPTIAIVPEVVHQQRAVAARIAAIASVPAPNLPNPLVAPTSVRRSALADGRRAAFTLRLDAERHLKLRLACTFNHRSAQQLLTEALDRLLAAEPELANLAEQMAHRTQR